MLQIPLMITWFMSLRYITNLPEVYTQLQTPFLWMKDMSAYDPYFILPIASACVMSLSIVYSPNLKSQNLTMPFMAPFIKYLK
jgi:membrane protein insertase Oxa1/YidC/SpoIIIJ